MRHGEDQHSKSKEWGSLNQTGVEQVKRALGNIKTRLLKNLGGLVGQRIIILHSPTLRAEQSTKIISDGLEETGCKVVSVVEPVVWYENDGHIEREFAKKYMMTKITDPERTIIVSHKNVLMALLQASWMNWWIKTRPTTFDPPDAVLRHGEVADDNYTNENL